VAREDEIQATFEGVAGPATATIRTMSDVDGEGAQYPKEHRDAELARATDEFARAHNEALAAQAELRAARMADAARVYADDPPDPERTADLLQADQLSRGETRLTAKNRLIPEAYRLLQLGQWKRAAVYATAARLAGAPDEALAARIAKAQDAVLPNRIRAIQMADVAEKAYAKAWVAMTTADANVKNMLGRGPDTASASIALKLHEWNASQAEGRPYVEPAGLPTSRARPTKRVADSLPLRPAGQR